MPNRITRVAMPDRVTAGEPFDVTVDYTADDDDELAIRYTGNFDGAPGAEPLAATAQRKTFAMTVIRRGAGDSCRVELRFGNQWISLVAVT